jgi:carbon-monoxide dehydrogenase medium subunit
LDLLQKRHEPVHTLVDLTNIAEMNVIETRGDELFVGAAAPLSRVATSSFVLQNAQALVEACNLIAGPQVRNVATLGGNVAHALPAADGTIALLALDARAEIADFQDRQRVPLGNLFLGPGKTALQAGQLLVGFYISLRSLHHGSAFARIMHSQGIALPILNMALWLEREEENIKDIRIAVGPGGPLPFRSTAAEEVLRGMRFNEATITHALETQLAQVQFRTSPLRASADYRRHLVGGLFTETLTTAWERAV